MGRGRKTHRVEAGKEGAPPTLREIAAENISSIIATCRCKHQRIMDPRRIASKLGDDFPLDELHLHLRCTACRKRGMVRVEVTWRD